MQMLRKSISSEVLVLVVRRDFVLRDALREAQKRKFDPTKMIKVCINLHMPDGKITLYI